jgi:hypothetical protein
VKGFYKIGLSLLASIMQQKAMSLVAQSQALMSQSQFYSQIAMQLLDELREKPSDKNSQSAVN